MSGPNKPKQKICFIVNPVSGRKREVDIGSFIKQNIDSARFQYEIKFTQRRGHASELSKDAVQRKFDIIVAVGGDGTINEVAIALIGKKPVLGIIPRGSGNGLARHLGIPRSLLKALQLINQSHFTKIDTATLNGKPFISIAGVGFDALVAKEFAASERRGLAGYINIITRHFLNYKPKKYTLIFDEGQKITERAFFIAFANSNQFGYNTTIAPNARLNDGKLDICIVKKTQLVEVPIVANLLFLKRIDLASNVTIIQSKGLVVKQKKKRLVNIDGEAIKMDKKIRVEINPLSLRIIIPKNKL